MLDAQKRLSTGFLVLLSLPTAAVGFALSSGIATTTWLLSTRYDLHLENILWRPLAVAGAESRVILIDVVSVAGVTFGPPLWDLVKYESYATGELWALRSERIETAGIGDGTGRYRCRIRTEDPGLAPFLASNWHALMRAAFVSQHGRVDERAYRFIRGYFNAAMALNTTGIQRQGRLLRATEDFNAVLRAAD